MLDNAEIIAIADGVCAQLPNTTEWSHTELQQFSFNTDVGFWLCYQYKPRIRIIIDQNMYAKVRHCRIGGDLGNKSTFDLRDPDSVVNLVAKITKLIKE